MYYIPYLKSYLEQVRVSRATGDDAYEGEGNCKHGQTGQYEEQVGVTCRKHRKHHAIVMATEKNKPNNSHRHQNHNYHKYIK